MTDMTTKPSALDQVRPLVEALRDLVCCPAFNGAVFARDPDSHRAWTLARAALAQAEGRAT